MDSAVNKWLGSLREELSQLADFDKEDVYFKMPVTGLYVLRTTRLNRYLALTKEKRTGKFSVFRTAIICLEYFFLLLRALFRLRTNTVTAYKSDNYFALFFGNHRVRVCSVNMQEDLVVDLTSPKPEFNSNSYLVGTSAFRKWAPKMTIEDAQGRIIREQRLNGIAINRIKDRKIALKEKDFVFEYRKAQQSAEKTIPLTMYIDCIENKIVECQLVLQEVIEPAIRTTKFNWLLDSLGTVKEDLINSGLSVVTTCPSHRDLNRGNVLVESELSDFKVIDWEFFSEATIDYDIFVFVSNVRHNKNFEGSYKNFQVWAQSNNLEISRYSRSLFLLEELRFLVDNLSIRKEKRKSDFQIIEDTVRSLCSSVY